MNELDKTRSRIMKAPDVAKELALADKYLRHAEELGRDFALPAQYAHFEPLLKFKGRPDKMADFMRSVRDSYEKGTPVYQDIAGTIKTLVVRMSARRRRERLDKAVDTAVRQGIIFDDYRAKDDYSRFLTQVWNQKRKEMVDNNRKAAGVQRFSRDMLDELTDEFWAGVDADIAKGKLPRPK